MNQQKERYTYGDYNIVIFNLAGVYDPPFVGKAVKDGVVHFSEMGIESGMVYDKLVDKIDGLTNKV